MAELDRLARARQNFAFESTLSGRSYEIRLKNWNCSGKAMNRIRQSYLTITFPP